MPGRIAFALLVAPIIPGAGSDPWLDVANTGRDNSAGRSYRPGLAPFVDIGDKLNQTANEELFTVQLAPARLLAHRRPRPVLGRQRGPVDAQRGG